MVVSMSFVSLMIASGVVALTAQEARRVYEPVPKPLEFAFGADLSFLRQAEEGGRVFKDGDTPKPGLKLFKDHGYNWIRLRVFVEPVKEGLPNGLAYTIAEAQDAKKLGYKLLLDFHYAQSWADPNKQPTPDAWRGVGHAEMAKKVFEYTRDTIESFQKADVLPDMVQIGNELRNGMLWPSGQLPANWDNFAEYVYAGVNGVDAGRGNSVRPRIMVQYDEGGSWEAARAFWDKLFTYGVPVDVIGYSYYPWWHGPISELRRCLNETANRYNKEVMVVETAYHYRTNGETRGHRLPFPETPEGQKEFLEEVTRTVMAVPRGLGTGVFWWEPTLTGSIGSRGMFDPDGKALPSVSAYDKWTGH